MIKKRYLAFIVLMIILIGNGCNMQTREEYGDLIELTREHLVEKYNREFELLSFEGEGYLTETEYFHFATEGIDEENEKVTVIAEKVEGEFVLEDNYFSYIIRPDLEEYLGNIVKSEFQDVKVFVENSSEYVSNELNAEKNLADLYVEEEEYRVLVKIYINGMDKLSSAEYARKMSNIETDLLNDGHSYTIYMFVVSPEVYAAVDRYEQTDFWNYYATHREPDGEKYYYLYHEFITKGVK